MHEGKLKVSVLIRFALTVLTRLPVICHYWVWLRFIEGHSSDDHSIGPSPRRRRSRLVSQDFGSPLRFDLNDLNRTICLWGGRVFPNKCLLILVLLVDIWRHIVNLRFAEGLIIRPHVLLHCMSCGNTHTSLFK